ncbi:MAG: 1-acyl-sn-glycerol-3-phosphate acyltransferase [Myxococcales bacterium]|nr:1-acyl-sn-glycerol-3-phosphate acyltransferase [Myxococcales bacterium]
MNAIVVTPLTIAGTVVKIVAGLIWLGLIVAVLVPILIVLLPFRRTRIVLTNHAGTLIGRSLLWLSGCPVAVAGREHARTGESVIFVGNHTSLLDTFTSIWLVPAGTVGIAKKELVWYPFFGQAWFLSGHLLIDRTDPARSVGALRELATYLRRNRLSVLLWPEGTRAPDGRLRPFKKGFAHMALQTGLPVVPMVTSGAHLAWRKGHIGFKPVPIRVEFLPPIETKHWTLETLETHIEEVRQRFIAALPPEQRPIEGPA